MYNEPSLLRRDSNCRFQTWFFPRSQPACPWRSCWAAQAAYLKALPACSSDLLCANNEEFNQCFAPEFGGFFGTWGSITYTITRIVDVSHTERAYTTKTTRIVSSVTKIKLSIKVRWDDWYMLRLTFVVWLSCVVWLQSFNHLDSLYPSAGHPADPASVIVWKRPLRSPMPGNARKSKFASGQNYWECNSRCSKASQRYSNTAYPKNIDNTSNFILHSEKQDWALVQIKYTSYWNRHPLPPRKPSHNSHV